MGLFLLVRMGLVHMWALYERPNVLNKMKNNIKPIYIILGRKWLMYKLMDCFILFND